MKGKYCTWEKRYFFGPTYRPQCRGDKLWSLYNEYYKFCPLCGGKLKIDTVDYDAWIIEKEKIDKNESISQLGERTGTYSYLEGRYL